MQGVTLFVDVAVPGYSGCCRQLCSGSGHVCRQPVATVLTLCHSCHIFVDIAGGDCLLQVLCAWVGPASPLMIPNSGPSHGIHTSGKGTLDNIHVKTPTSCL
jgi:hypothetical protein